MKSVLVIGLNHFGVLLAKKLTDLGHEVLAVDLDENRVNDIISSVTDAQIGDSTNENFLKSLGVNNFDICVVAITEDFQSSLETTSLLKELGAEFVISLAEREVQAKFLLRNGADEVINPEKQMAEWAAIRYASDHLLDYVKLDEEHGIYEVPVPEDWIGKTVGQIDIRKKYDINIMAVKINGKMNLSVNPDTVMEEGRSLLVLGNIKSMQRCFKI